MYIRIAFVTLLLWGAGCTQESGPRTGKTNDLGAGLGVVSPGVGTSRPLPRLHHRSFANSPDLGDLVAYPARREVKHDGAYTWHRAGLSEEHALHAVGGVMRITTPAGEHLQYRYERHVEHPSGDWTWIGRVKDGAASDEIILTFGEHAAFGTISQPGKAPLKLTMSGGASWLIETDRWKIANIDNPATRPRSPDFLIPPKITAGLDATVESSPAFKISVATESAQVATTTTVDVLLGYTDGFAAAQGGQSQAVTRLNNMVEISNQAYGNSQIDARVRLVHAMQVSYPDNTSNGSALEALTGFRAPSTRTTPDAAFAALRSARNQYGADLVSLVRQFNSPENDGCGIAWLIGGGQSGIDSSDEYFGYSVVSDGRDAGADGKTYFCREETLAHELGHNMGSQHDRVTATVDGSLKYGVYPYSFGFKTAADAGSFYTVMGYGDSGHTTYRIFSNPRSTYCGGNPCGAVDQADNARSLAQTFPLIAGFRATVVSSSRVKTDINGDGKSDIILRNESTNQLSYWLMNGSVRTGQWSTTISAAHRVVGTGDFDGDGLEDLLWMDNNNSFVWIFRARPGGGFDYQFVDFFPPGWLVVGVADFNGDGRSDILIRNASAGYVSYWLMNGPSRIGTSVAGVPGSYRVVGTGDFDGDGVGDSLWTDSSKSHLWIFRSGSQYQFVDFYPPGWTVDAITDINGDGKSDIVLRNAGTSQLTYWLMAGPTRIGSGVTSVPSTYRIVGASDFDGDGRGDLLWADSNNSLTWLFRSRADGGFDYQFVDFYPPGWQVVNGGS